MLGDAECVKPETGILGPCAVCGERTEDSEGRGRPARAACIGCGRIVCHRCTNPEIRERGLGSVHDFQHFLVKPDAGSSESASRMVKRMCPYCGEKEARRRPVRVLVTPPPAGPE
jgi:hypothetical protein